MSRSEGANLSLIIAATQFEEHIEFPKTYQKAISLSISVNVPQSSVHS